MSSAIKIFGHDPLVFAIPVSLAFHAGLYAMGFTMPDRPPTPKAKVFDVTMVNVQNVEAPKKADFIANSNQVGSGSKAEKSKITSRFAADENNDKNGDDFFTTEKNIVEVKPKLTPEILTTKGKTNKRVDKKPEEKKNVDPVTNKTSSTDQTDAIAKLMAEMSEQEQRYARRPRIRFVDSLSAKGTVEAKYIHNWSRKLERIGNINFPKIAIQLSLSGTLILNATLDRMGRVTEIQVTTSSGSRILDEAAVKIVKLAAPYEPLPPKIRAKYDRLNITRTIVFHRGKNNKVKFYSK
ncbi:MAG: TonB family protein [Cocleimonas sp.]|nr:TonB family protein [Cocleimonas sp.]